MLGVGNIWTAPSISCEISKSRNLWQGELSWGDAIACSAGVFFERAICSRRRHVETSRREEEMGRVKGSGEGGGGRVFFFSPPPPPFPSFALAPTVREPSNRKGYYFYSPQSSTVIKSKMAATTTLRTRTRFRPPEIRLHCRLGTRC